MQFVGLFGALRRAATSQTQSCALDSGKYTYTRNTNRNVDIDIQINATIHNQDVIQHR